MKPRSTEFYSDAYAYAVGYRDGRQLMSNDLPSVGRFSDHHVTLYQDGYRQGVRDLRSYDNGDTDHIYNPMEAAA